LIDPWHTPWYSHAICPLASSPTGSFFVKNTVQLWDSEAPFMWVVMWVVDWNFSV